MTRPTQLLFAAISLTMVLVACGKKPEEAAAEAAIKAATGADATVRHDGDATTTSIKTKDGELNIQSGEGLSLPADFPTDVYLPAGYQVKNVMNMGPMHSLVVDIPGQAPAVSKEITGKMEAGGWKTAMSMQSGQGSMLSFTRDSDKRTATYTMSPGQDGKLTLSVQQTADAH